LPGVHEARLGLPLDGRAPAADVDTGAGRGAPADPARDLAGQGPGVEHRRTAYDTTAAVEAFRALGYPDADGMAERVDPDEVSAMFEAGAEGPPAPESLTGR
jgi:hypothetical protein